MFEWYCKSIFEKVIKCQKPHVLHYKLSSMFIIAHEESSDSQTIRCFESLD